MGPATRAFGAFAAGTSSESSTAHSKQKPSDMDNRSALLRIAVVIAMVLLFVCVQETNAGQQKKKKIVIHVPIHKKIEKHIHTVVKHVHHHHKPLVLKEEKKVIHEDHRPIQIHQTKELVHHHEKHDHHDHHDHHDYHEHQLQHPVSEVEEEEEEHIHHHHNYEHKGRDDFIGGDGSSSEER
ncbi:histidine-rich glycoprotein isoform X2 [Drosophila miranda]|uniref:histidine-rich glycoprotein isoform X2 n=1 Tax=Drosophila miranda TaxID=7229 RepID=UPI0007E80394|nr:histidine-rich glycoprotein isoform X2 [Drosophila miranda]